MVERIQQPLVDAAEAAVAHEREDDEEEAEASGPRTRSADSHSGVKDDSARPYGLSPALQYAQRTVFRPRNARRPG